MRSYSSRGDTPHPECCRPRGHALPPATPSLYRSSLRGLSLTPLVIVLVAACSDDVVDGTGGAGPVETVLHPDAPPLPGFDECKVVITENVTFEGHTHKPVCTAITYVSNPPSSGDHWPVWAKYQSYTDPVPRQMLVHNLEHGSIILSSDCPSGCPDVIAAFESARDTLGLDPKCVTADPEGPTSRIIITPDPLLELPVGISAWQATYAATCIDQVSIDEFVAKHYGKGPEDLCNDGKDPATPESGVPACMAVP